MSRSIRRLLAPAIVTASALGALAHEASAQLALYNPQFPFAGAQAAPVNNQQGNTVQWLGADGGSMALFPDGTTTFWAFGDTFLGPTGTQNRGVVAPLVVNTIAIGLPQNGQFNPYYYYRGNYTYNAQYFPTNNPTPFFEDPLSQPTDPNQPTSRFWVGKAI